MAEWQCALLKPHLAELESCTARQRELCRQLGDLILTPGDIHLLHRNPELSQRAKRVREQGRRFAALVRRIQKNIETLRCALEGPRRIYSEPQPRYMSKEF